MIFMKMKNKFYFFKPMMFEFEYKFIEKYLSKDDILLEWGCGNSTLYFSDLVKKVISIEHDIKWVNIIENISDVYNINNINLYHVPMNIENKDLCRYKLFENYVNLPKEKTFNFTKVLIDGRARKYCAKYIYDLIDENVIVFIHDFNREDYHKVLKYYDIIEQEKRGEGIVSLKKKKIIKNNNDYY